MGLFEKILRPKGFNVMFAKKEISELLSFKN